MYEVHKNTTGYWWRLKAGNGETLSHSEIYTTKRSALDGIAAAKRISGSAEVLDLT